jgi:hypothetical protein
MLDTSYQSAYNINTNQPLGKDMKLPTSNGPVKVSGGNNTSSFSIAMNGKAFRVLSDTLYQNKIGSIVREISCNAYDAHVMADKSQTPFVIHLPDAFEPWFSVQDFGIGLSPQDIAGVFTVYFQSTKDDSNDTVGAFGLGAKTPFSYTDQFTVTSVKDGIRYIYSAFITESGVPSIIEMDQSATDNANGVEIKMSVKREDYNRFASEVADQLKFFKVKPTVVNSRNFQFQNVSSNLIVDTLDVAISNDRATYNQPWAHVIQGNVGYPLDVNQLSGKIDALNAELLAALNCTQTRLYFDIGQIGVTASREGIEYTAHTIAHIDAKLTVVRAHLTAHINAQMTGFTRAWDKAAFLNGSPVLSRLAHAAGLFIPNVKCNTAGNYYFYFSALLTRQAANGITVSNGSVKTWEHCRAGRVDGIPLLIPSTDRNDTTIVLRDTGNKPNIRAKHYLSQQPCIASLLEVTLYDGEYDDAFIASLSAALGGFDNIIRLSSIVPPVVVSVAANGTTIRNSYSRPTHYSHREPFAGYIRQWTREFNALADNDDDVAYVVIADMELKYNADHDLIKKYEMLVAFMDTVIPIIGIRENDLKRIDGMANYIKLSDYIQTVTDTIAESKKLHVKWRHATITAVAASHLSSSFLLRDDLLTSLKNIAPNAKITKLLNIVAKRQPNTEEVRKLNRIA